MHSSVQAALPKLQTSAKTLSTPLPPLDLILQQASGFSVHRHLWASGSPITLHSGPLCRKSTFTCRSQHTLQSALSPVPWNGDLSPQSHRRGCGGRSPRSSPDDATSACLDAGREVQSLLTKGAQRESLRGPRQGISNLEMGTTSQVN